MNLDPHSLVLVIPDEFIVRCVQPQTRDENRTFGVQQLSVVRRVRSVIENHHRILRHERKHLPYGVIEMRHVQNIPWIHGQPYRHSGFPVHAQSDRNPRSVQAMTPRISDMEYIFLRGLEVQRCPICEDHIHFHAVSFLEDLSEERYDCIAIFPKRSTVRYTDLGALASGPYSARTISLYDNQSKRLTDNPVISTELATNATVSATTELP